jgi:23S rRNA (cytosine1962-C5)-methyltransferase
LIHSEADGLPGLIVDRFDKLLVLQVATAGMENLLPIILESLNQVFLNPKIILRNDIPARKLEGLEEYVKILHGELEAQNILVENDLKFYFDPMNGQKTGWFFDQRENRKFVASLVKGKDILDCYCYNGGFGINAAVFGANSVTFIDSSESAIKNVEQNIKLNNLEGNFEYINGKVFDELENLAKVGKKFQTVVLDPPAFIKSKKDFFVGIKGYEKLTKIAAKLVAKNGYLFIASCSHNAGLQDLIKASASGINKAGRNAKIIRIFGAGFDHPLHPFLPESEYLKSIIYQLN